MTFPFTFPFGKPATTASYSIARSLRFNSTDSAYLSRTPGGAGDRKTWTWSCWVKRGSLGSAQAIFGCYVSSADSGAGAITFNSSDQLRLQGWSTTWRTTTRVFRDPAAWFHLVVVLDTTQATGANRVKIYIDGVQETAFGTSNDPTLNTDYGINQASAHRIGDWDPNGTTGVPHFNGYLAEIHFVDGTALTPSTFGQTDSTTGQWVPKQVTGVSYGTNGFYLPFSDNSGTTSTTLGKDGAGSNNWTPNNFSVTAGTGNDSLTDTPTNNFCTLSPLTGGAYVTLSDGNLRAIGNSVSFATARFGTMAIGASDKAYFEFTCTATAGGGPPAYPLVGIAAASYSNPASSSERPGDTAVGGVGYGSDGNKNTSSTSSAFGASYTANDVIGVHVDGVNGAVYFSKNGTYQNSGDPTSGASRTGAAFTWTPGSAQYVPAVCGYNSSGGVFNFGQRAFAYTPATGYTALCASNLPTPSIVKPSAQFDVTLWGGDATSPRSIANTAGFAPDLVWLKARTSTQWNVLTDSTRGAGKSIYSNATNAEVTNDTNGYVSAFNSNGFSVSAGGTGSAAVNTSAQNYVGWQWKKGVTPGFDIVSQTATASGNQTINHSLGVAPSFALIKATAGSAANWSAWCKGMGTDHLVLNSTAAKAASGYMVSQSSSTFVINIALVNASNTFIVYLFAEVAGFSKFGSYTGNGSADGPSVHCGFRPRFVLIKRTDTTGDWYIWDTSRNTFNVVSAELFANSSAIEASASDLDILSNGFKLRATTAGFNASGGTYIFAAFAEFPFKYSNAR